MSKFVKDPANPTDAELAAAIERGLASGQLVDAREWLAGNRTERGPVCANTLRLPCQADADLDPNMAALALMSSPALRALPRHVQQGILLNCIADYDEQPRTETLFDYACRWIAGYAAS